MTTQNYNFSAVDIIDSTCSITECVMERQLHPNEKNDSIIDRLRTWTALNPNMLQYSLTSLLHLLNHFFPTISVDARTLLKISKQFHDSNDSSLCFQKHLFNTVQYLYNSEFLIYNVHYLIHLSEDVLRYGKLDSNL